VVLQKPFRSFGGCKDVAMIGMDQCQGHGAFPQQHDVSCALNGTRGTHLFQQCDETGFDRLLVLARDRAGRMTRQIGEFDRDAGDLF
jgi:hypothetical protein